MIEKIKKTLTSRKFWCFVIAVLLTLFGKMQSSDLVWVMAVFMGTELAQKNKLFDNDININVDPGQKP